MQYRLRTLLIVLALGPVLLAGMWFGSARLAHDQTTLAFFLTLTTFSVAFLIYGAVAIAVGLATARAIDAMGDWLTRQRQG